MGITQDSEGNSTAGLAQLIIAKHRNGEVRDVDLRFREEFARFEEYSSMTLEPILSGGFANEPVKNVTFGSKMNQDPFAGSDEFSNTPF
jgi:replicative DNA helicase